MVDNCQKRISGPMMDRIDIYVEVPRAGFCPSRLDMFVQGDYPDGWGNADSHSHTHANADGYQNAS